MTAGFIDLHCHGGAGVDFGDADVDGALRAATMHLQHGTTTLFPTVTSSDFSTLEQAICAVEQAQKTMPVLGGVHLEGPYFSPAQTGAQNGNALRKPQPQEYMQILKNHNIARWDYAPEMDKDGAFLQALMAAGTIPAAGHTDATCEQMVQASKQGCRLITHLYSCTSTIRRENGFRIAGVVEAAYLLDDVCAELIADGCHLPHSLLQLAYKLKGPERLALVTDAMRAAGFDVVLRGEDPEKLTAERVAECILSYVQAAKQARTAVYPKLENLETLSNEEFLKVIPNYCSVI